MNSEVARVLRWGLATALVVAPTGALGQCAKDGECNGGRAKEPVGAVATGETPARHGSAFIDPLGLALFGPTAGVEGGAGHLTGTLYGRLFSAGWLTQNMFGRLALGYGLGLRARYYFLAGLAGPHVGLEGEYIRTRLDDPALLLAWNAHYFLTQVEGGYRFAFGRFYLGGAASFGYAFHIANTYENLPEGNLASLVAVNDVSSFYGAASLELGLYF